MNTSRSTALTAATIALFAAAGIAGCHRDNDARTTTPAPTTTTQTAEAPRTPGEAVGDAAITAKVKTVMLADPDVKGLQVNVDTVNGVVTLTGTVASQAEADKAAAIAARAEGVKSVNNNLTKRG